MPYSEEFAIALIGSDYVKLGKDLSPEDQKKVKSVFVFRFTGDNVPKWASGSRPDGSKYMVQFKDDREWLEETWFAVNRDGKYNQKYNSCASRPTFPLGERSRNDADSPDGGRRGFESVH